MHLVKKSLYHHSFNTTTMTSDTKISVAELDKHAKPDDCWIVVNGKVYDFTTFAPNHPGGPDSKPLATNNTRPPNPLTPPKQ